MNNLPKSLKVTAIEHESSGVITAFVTQMPGLLVQANSTDEIKYKLDRLLENFIKKLDASRKNLEIETKTVA